MKAWEALKKQLITVWIVNSPYSSARRHSLSTVLVNGWYVVVKRKKVLWTGIKVSKDRIESCEEPYLIHPDVKDGICKPFAGLAQTDYYELYDEYEKTPQLFWFAQLN